MIAFPRRVRIVALVVGTVIAAFFSADSAISQSLGVESDDFSACQLDTGLWTYVDPVGDGAIRMTGGQLELVVPQGTRHDVWSRGNDSVRVMQAANDTDFELEVKFESGVNASYQLQGLLVEQDSANFLRFDFYGVNGNTRLFAAHFVDGAPTTQYNRTVYGGNTSPLYLRVGRVGDQWTQWHSTDGQTWVEGANFSHALSVSAVGVFAGNAGGGNPAHTAVVDYFFNTAAPINPEDGGVEQSTLTTSMVGAGSVTVEPAKAGYNCGEQVTLTAVADSGHVFSGWSGDASGSVNPLTLTMDADKNITATFVEATSGKPISTTHSLFLPLVQR